ncbi:MAG: dTDP-glucose pyrophosphorylase [Candidatus Latescibacterota bacterium]
MLLAAGRGQRLAPYTDRTPKPLIAVDGRPLLEYALRNLRAAGVREVLLVIGYRGAQIRDHFADGRSLDLSLHYIDQQGIPGTGAATLLAEAFTNQEPFFLGWGDIIAARSEYQRLFDIFIKEQPDALMLIERSKDVRSGAAIDIQDGLITSLVEKPAHSTALWNQAGIAVYRHTIFSCLHQLHPSERGELEFTAAVQMLVDQGLCVRGIPMQTPRLHLTHPSDIKTVEQTLKNDARYGLSVAESGWDD